MSRKAFLVQVELDVQAVTCPGVWLCSNGKVSLQIYMLDSCVQTASYKPNFPINFNEKFAFFKTFYSKHQLIELQKELHDEWLYIELVQWQSCDVGNVLASFQTTLDELLYPSTVKGSIAGVDLDLLMEPSCIFPGTIAPKIEISTKTTIEETLCVCTKPNSSTVVVNPKVLMSNQHKTRPSTSRKVCHSIAYSRRKRALKPGKARPPFCYRKPEDDLILRKPQYDLEGNYCSCRQSRSLQQQNITNLRRSQIYKGRPSLISPERTCSCDSDHKDKFCPVCSKYKGYFTVTPVTLSPRLPKKENSQIKPRTTLFSETKNCYTPPTNDPCPCPYCSPEVSAEEKPDPVDATASDAEENNQTCYCTETKRSLAEKLHAKLTKTLSSIPKTIQWSCADYDYECDCCDCPPISDAELYRNLQKFYGDLYEQARKESSCVPDCPGLKSV